MPCAARSAAAARSASVVSYWALRIGDCLSGVFPKTISTPFIDVAMHFIQPPEIGGVSAHVSVMHPIILIVVCQLRCDLVAKVVKRRRPSTTSILPLWFVALKPTD